MSASTALLPEYIVVVAVLVTMIAAMIRRPGGTVASWVALIGILGALWATIDLWTMHIHPAVFFNQSLTVDNYSLFVNVLVLIAASSTLLLGWTGEREHEEFPILVLIAALGMMSLGMVGNLIALFLGIEVLSLPLYVLSASHRTVFGGEAGLKYLLLGAFSSGILLFGLALVYGATGTMNFVDFASSVNVHSPLLAAGLMLTLVGLLFKLGIVPFHMWVPKSKYLSPASPPKTVRCDADST